MSDAGIDNRVQMFAGVEYPQSADDVRHAVARVLTPRQTGTGNLETSTPACLAVEEALRLWETRLNVTQITHKTIYGAVELIERLRRLPAGDEVEQFGFMNDRVAGNLVFAGRPSAFIGAVVVER